MLSMTTILEKQTTPTPANMADVQPKYFMPAHETAQPADDKRTMNLGRVATTVEDNRLTVTEQPNLNAMNPENFAKQAELQTAALVDNVNNEKVSAELGGTSIVTGEWDNKNDILPEGLDLGEPDNDEVDNQ